MISPAATALLLLAAAPPSAPSADFAWVIDGEIPGRIASAQAEAMKIDAMAAESDRLRKDVLARRQAALDEKATLEPTLPSLSRGKRSDAEKRIAELDGIAVAQATRAKQLEAEGATRRSAALAQRTFAIALGNEGKARLAEDAKFAIEEDADLGPLSDARLAELTAYFKRRMARLPKQLAVLDQELDRAVSIVARGDVVARKDGARAAAAADEAWVLRIADELRYRADTKSDEDILAKQMEDTAKAKAAERESPTPSPTPAGGKDSVDDMLDRVLAEQDRKAAASASSSKTQRTLLRIVAGVAGAGALGAILVFVLRRQ